MSIRVGAFYPDAQLKESQFANALTKVAMALASSPDASVQKNAPEVEVLFMLSGKFDSPGFEGMRIRRYDSKAESLIIEAAVPEKIVNSENAETYVIAAMLDAAENAAEFLGEIQMEFDCAAHMALIESLSDTSDSIKAQQGIGQGA
ncbi:hypothetical protein P886_3194 [Alteromonadaceae bacterium 2753L.S.0a.02]|nr:hypothetical protein P886_3194 [Alteromonadaceae bacterium 2753L.S.0a.02]